MRRLAILALLAALVAIACGGTNPIVEPPAGGDPTAVAGVGTGEPVPAVNPDRVDPVVQIAEGVAPAGPWRAWAYRLKDGSMCLEYAGAAGDGSGGASCGTESTMIEPTTSASGPDAFISGGTSQPTAAAVVLRFDDRSTRTAALVSPGTLSTIGARYWFTAMPLGTRKTTVDVVDGDGNVLETTTLTGQ